MFIYCCEKGQKYNFLVKEINEYFSLTMVILSILFKDTILYNYLTGNSVSKYNFI